MYMVDTLIEEDTQCWYIYEISIHLQICIFRKRQFFLPESFPIYSSKLLGNTTSLVLMSCFRQSVHNLCHPWSPYFVHHFLSLTILFFKKSKCSGKFVYSCMTWFDSECSNSPPRLFKVVIIYFIFISIPNFNRKFKNSFILLLQ